MKREDVSFSTIDGLTLRGTLYPAGKHGPAVILTPGFNCTKDMFIPDVALYFQQAGFTALSYDPRGIGSSDGKPRNDIDPTKQVEDYSDALTFLSEQAFVDPTKIIFWGFSFGATVTLCSAALDRRAKAVIAVCPLTKFEYTEEKRPKVLAKAIQDRISQTKGNSPFYIPMLTEQGENPAGFGVGVEKDNYRLLTGAKETIAPTFENRTTIQTYYRLFAWQPFDLWKHLSPTPVMFLVPGNDVVSPPELQQQHFEGLAEPKSLYIEPDKGHMDILSGESFSRLMEIQITFIKSHL
ncbi:MAG: hypothetical protein M1821_002536 [Bathelium mastoideum]|nr:MAG: hypothetical protein M1821_002536 [Bathelium mastoideum]